MRIISRTIDYYDSCQNYRDEFIFHRKQKRKLLENLKSEDLKSLLYFEYTNWKEKKGLIACRILGFCGKYYIVWMDHDKNRCYYDLTDISEKINFYETGYGKYKHARKFDPIYNWKRVYSQYAENFESLIQENYFLKYRVPCFTIGYEDQIGYVLILNPDLKDFHFQEIFDPYSACQEIEMFLRNDLVHDSTDKVKVDEKHRMESRFDRWSFKKLPWK